MNAVIAVADPNAPSATSWTLLTATLVILACGAVVLLAHRTRNPPVRPRPLTRPAHRATSRSARERRREVSPRRCTSSAVAVERFSV